MQQGVGLTSRVLRVAYYVFLAAGIMALGYAGYEVLDLYWYQGVEMSKFEAISASARTEPLAIEPAPVVIRPRSIGTLIAFLFVQSRLIEISLFPYAVLLQVTPIVAIAPLIIIWVKDTRIALILCAVVVAIFPIISNTTLGLRSVDHGLVNLFRMCRASRWQILLRLRIPSALPYFFGGLRIASGLALIGAVVAEFVAGTGGQGAGLAYQILLAGMQLNVPRLFAALFLIAVAGVALFAATVAISRIALSRWHESETAAPD